MVTSLGVSVNLNLQFAYDDNYTCKVNHLMRECGGVVLYSNLSNTAFYTQSLQFKEFSNETYLISVSLLNINNEVYSFDYTNL
jgi:hypothetical protein